MAWETALAGFHARPGGLRHLRARVCTSVHVTSPYAVLREVRRPTHADNRDRTDDFPEAKSYHSQPDQLRSEPFGHRRAFAPKSTSLLMPQCWHRPFEVYQDQACSLRRVSSH